MLPRPILLLAIRPALFTLAAGLLLTLLASYLNGQEIRRHAQVALVKSTQSVAQALEQKLRLHAEILRGLQNAFSIQPNLNELQFQQMLERQNTLLRHPGILGIAFIRQLGMDELQPFLDKKKASSPLLNPGRYDSRANQAEIQMLDYFYPANSSYQTLLGLDLSMRPEVKTALSTAQNEGRGLISAPFRLPGELRQPVYFLQVFPVHQPGAGPARAQGGLAILYRADLLLGQDFQHMPALHLQLHDQGGAPNGNRVILYTTPGKASQELQASQLINLPGRQWHLDARANIEAITPKGRSTFLIIGLGIGTSLLIAVIVLFQSRSREMAIRLAEDITADLRLHEDRHRQLEMLTSALPDCLIIRSLDGRIRYANEAALHAFSNHPRSLLERSDAVLTPAELGLPHEALIRDCVHHLPHGKVAHYEALIVPLRDEDGAAAGTALLARNRTEQVTADAVLKQEVARLTQLLTQSGEFFWEQDETGHFSFVAGGFLTRYQLAPAYFLGKTLRDLCDAALTHHEWLAHKALRRDLHAFHDFNITLHIDQNPVCLSLSGHPVCDHRGELLCYRGAGRDLSAIRATQAALLAERQRIIATLESISDGIITTDTLGCIDYLNPVACALTGWESDAAMGKAIETVLQIISPDDRLPLTTLLRRVLETGQAPINHRNGILLNRFGLNFHIQEAVACIRDQQGQIIGAAVVFRDQTDWLARSSPAA